MKKCYALFAGLLVAASTTAQTVVITELQYQPPSSGGPNSATEFVELYNNGTTNIDLTGWKLQGSGFGAINYTFPAHTLAAGDYVVLSNNTTNLASIYGVTGLQYTGSLLNAGMSLVLRNASSVTVDSLAYLPTSPWPTIAAGNGPSIQLCDYNSDNANPANWKRSITKASNIGSRDVFGTPGVQNNCPGSPVIQFRFNNAQVQENAGAKRYGIYIDNPASTATTVQVVAYNISGTVGQDVLFTSPQTITFPANFQGMDSSFQVTIVDDTLFEPEEQIIFVLKNASNSALIRTDTFMLQVNEDFQDRPVTRDLILIGIADDEAGGAARLVEVFAKSDIPNLARYGLGCANNGGASPGVEFYFPSVSAKKGDNFFITNDSGVFHRFYGFPADFIDNGGTNGALSFNGNDAMELYEDGRIIDRYGVDREDGTGKAWEYTDGWGKRVPKTGPDQNVFIAANWSFSGKDVFDGKSKNTDATKPYPLNTYYYEEPEDTTNIGIDAMQPAAEGVRIFPNPVGERLTVVASHQVERISVYDVTGAMQTSFNPLQTRFVINTSELVSGAYILHIEFTDGNAVYRRFVCD